MKSIKLKKQEIPSFVNSYDWSLATDNKDKKLFSTVNEFNAITMHSIFNQFDSIEINEKDIISGIYATGQKTMLAKAPFVFETIMELKV